MKVFIGFLLTLSLTSIQAISPPLILTKLIKQNETEQARKQSAVNPSLFLNRKSYSGFFTVDEKYNSNLFFWFIEAENYKPDTPWIIWLQGGPGVTSLAGLFDEIGPFKSIDDGRNISARQWTWAKDHSLLFIDNPVGAGYSFTENTDGYPQDMETIARHLYSCLRQFLMVFPELRTAPLYIAGESYAGRYIPAFGVKIFEQDHSIGTLELNFQGIMLGNPVINRESIADYSTVYYHWGLIDDQGLLAVKPIQDDYNKALKEKDTDKAIILRKELLDKLDDISKQQNEYNLLVDSIFKLDAFGRYLDQEEVKEALHVGYKHFDFSSGLAYEKLTPDFLVDIRSKVEILLDNHYRVLIYCGQLDLIAPCVLNAQARRRYWQWNGRALFLSAPRTAWLYNNRVVGYVKSGGSLTEVLVRGAGHLAPMDKPEETTNLITKFIQGQDLGPPNFQASTKDTPEYKYSFESERSNTIHRESFRPNAGLVASIAINVLLMLSIVCGVLYALRWKRRHHSMLYMDELDDTSTI